MFTTLSPCTMCSGTLVLFGIKRCVMGENDTFVGGESILKDHGIEVVNLNLDSCKKLMSDFIAAKPEVWNEVSACKGGARVALGRGQGRALTDSILRRILERRTKRSAIYGTYFCNATMHAAGCRASNCEDGPACE